MNNFIELTSQMNDEKILLNINSIIIMTKSDKGGCYLAIPFQDSQGDLYVKEDYETIKRKIWE